jgi:hypothetical protein
MSSLWLEYDLVGTDPKVLARNIAELCSELDRPGTLRDQLKAFGVDPAEVDTFSGLAVVESEAHGLDYTTIGAIVTLSLPLARAGAKVTATMALDVWKKILLPRLEQRLGEGALVERVEQKRRVEQPGKAKEPAKKSAKKGSSKSARTSKKK